MPNLFEDDIDVFAIDPNKNYLEELVGDGKKFTSPEDLARAKAESDAFIEQLKREQEQLRTELSTRIKYEEFLDKLNSNSHLSNQRLQDDDEQTDDKSAMKPEQIEQILDQKLKQMRQQESAQQNLNVVKAKLSEALGPNYAQHLRRRASELDMDELTLNQLAVSNPKALFKLLDLDKTKGNDDLFTTAPRTQATGSMSSSTGKKGFKHYWDEYYVKQGPEVYFSPKVQNEIFQRMKEMGEEDFNNS